MSYSRMTGNEANMDTMVQYSETSEHSNVESYDGSPFLYCGVNSGYAASARVTTDWNILLDCQPALSVLPPTPLCILIPPLSSVVSMHIFIGPLVHTLNSNTIQYSPLSIVGVSSSGIIDFALHDVAQTSPGINYDALLTDILGNKELVEHGWSGHGSVKKTILKPGEFLCPGFIDTHTHAPQFPNIGLGQQYELLDWLKYVTFPAEERLADTGFATVLYKEVVRRVLAYGTTTCCYYGSLHLEATKVLADECHNAGQRAFVGKCNMDRNASPSYVEPSPAESVQTTRQLIEYITSLPFLPTTSPLVHPILTPRFAISCSDDLLRSLGALASEYPEMAIQTHISENTTEIEFTKELFPEAPHYAGVYDMFGLLRKRTVLGHACHLSEEEVNLVKERDAGIAHCPTSNFNIRSGMARVGYYLDRGIKVGLGTDCSGGYAPSILRTIQDACITSKILSLNTPDASYSSAGLAGKHLPIATLLYLATLGGASVCGLDGKVGNFVVGKEFDALVVSVPGAGGEGKVGGGGNPALWYLQDDTIRTLVERFMFGGDDRNVKEVYVCGRRVSGWGS